MNNHPLGNALFSQLLTRALKAMGHHVNFDTGEEEPLADPFTNEDQDVKVTPRMEESYYSGREPMTIDPEMLAQLFKVPKGNYRTPMIDQPPQETYEGKTNRVFRT